MNDAVVTAAGADGNTTGGFSEAPVRFNDGTMWLTSTDLSSDACGAEWGLTRSWSNGRGYSSIEFAGHGTVISQWPYLLQDPNGSGAIAVISNGATARYFDYNPFTHVYAPRHFLHETLVATGTGYVLTDTAGRQLTFGGFTTPTSRATYAQFQSLTDAAGNVTSVTGQGADGRINEMQRTSTTNGTPVTESLLYTYYGPDNAAVNRLSNVTLRRSVSGGPWSTVRQVDYVYYDGVVPYGTRNDLKTATIKDGAGNVLETKYYRYYTDAQKGGLLHYVVEGPAYGRLLGSSIISPFQQPDAFVAQFADYAFDYQYSYDQDGIGQWRVSQETAAGQGTFNFAYAFPNPSNGDGYNSWAAQATETMPDGSHKFVYTNYAGEVMLTGLATGTQTFLTFHEYDGQGREILTAYPSAVTGYDAGSPDLLDNVGGNYQSLNDSQGRLDVTDYGTTTTATSSTPGDVAGYVKDHKVQQGELGTPILLDAVNYLARTATGLAQFTITTYPMAGTTVYSNANGTGAETTSFSYTWLGNTAQPQSLTVLYPVVGASQNGPGTADTETVYYDAYGRPIWTKDADGFLDYLAYDPASGAVIKEIADVDTTRTGDFYNLPTGWATPAGGGLHLITQYTVDALGRVTKAVSPAGNVTYAVYNDPNHEVRVYPGFISGTGLTTGPTEDYREDWGHLYTESLTMSAAPHLTGGVPDGTEAVAGVQTLSRVGVNAAGQVVSADAYFNLAGLTYTNSPTFGTENVNFYRVRYGYDASGRPNRVQTSTGTITRVVYDSLGRPISTWVGTNDTGATDTNPSNGGGGGNNMLQVAGYVYDGGNVGDGDLTQETDYPGGTAANRVTQGFYDWRDRLVAVKGGVQAGENDGTHRPIVYFDMDNLDEVTGVSQYDGDGVTVGSSGGVPSKPSASLLRAYAVAAYDDQGRLYQEKTDSVDPSSGSVSANALAANYYYDRRGNLVATSAPGGLWTKDQYDGAGRLTVSDSTDGAGGTSWAAAVTAANDTVLEQQEQVYDGDGNVIESIDRQRFDNAAGAGPLGSPASGVGARDSYAAAYYDAADRLTGAADVGTNGGTAWTRPGSLPAASDAALVTSYAYTAAGFLDTVTDPRGIVAKDFYDNLGRVTKTVAAYTGGAPSNTSDQTTEFTYDGDGHTLTVQADLPGGAYQKTQYVYGVTTAGGNDINSDDLLAAVQHPDPTTGNPSTTLKDSFTVNALGDVKTATDRNGTVHTYSYDVLGRPTADAVTTLGAGVDGTVRRIETAYNGQGLPYVFTSYNAASGGSVVNQVQDAYNGLGQLTTEYQAHSGAVNISSTPKVQYAYSEMAGGANHSRPTTMTYPNGRVITFNYNAGLDNTVSRLSSMSDSGVTLEAYTYLGLDTVVKRAHPQPGVDLTYIKLAGEPNGDAGDQYTGLDRFGRVVDQRWVVAATGAATDRFQYGYDRDGNVLYKSNLVNPAFSELYHASGAANGYDNFNQLTAFARGTLSDTNGDGAPDTVASPSASESWTLDALGNWSGFTNGGVTQTRTANQENEITSISGYTTPTYDADGNMTADQNGYTYVYDAWNQPVQVKFGASVLETFGYDALGRRITETSSYTRDLFFSKDWQVVEERIGGNPVLQYVWSPVYVDALVERDRDMDGNPNDGLEERLYVQQDANWNVTAVISASGAVQERYVEDPYGQVAVLTASWATQGASNVGWVYYHQGGRRDGTTGLYNFRNRDYSPTLGRFVNEDPISFAGGDSNLYRFVGNSPAGYLDPSGLAKHLGGEAPEQLPNMNVPIPAGMSIIAPDQSIWGAIRSGLFEGGVATGQRIAGGVREVGAFFHDVGAIALYPFYKGPVPIRSGTFGGYIDALQQGQGAQYYLNLQANVLTFGLFGLGQGAYTLYATGDPGPLLDYWGGFAGATLAAGGTGVTLRVLARGLGSWWRGNCFPSDTLVATETGLRPISQVEAGDLVWSFDFEAGRWRLCEVECRHDTAYDGPLVTLDLGVGEVTATAYHPFWVIEGQELEGRPPLRHVDVNEDRGWSLSGRWVNSHDLREGDAVFLRHAGPVMVRRVWQRDDRTPVCNLTVRGLHTFAVGENQVLVHNTSGTNGPGTTPPTKVKVSGEPLIDSARNAKIRAGLYDSETGTVYVGGGKGHASVSEDAGIGEKPSAAISGLEIVETDDGVVFRDRSGWYPRKLTPTEQETIRKALQCQFGKPVTYDPNLGPVVRPGGAP